MSIINIDNLPEEEREKFKPYVKGEGGMILPSITDRIVFSSEYTVNTMRKEVFEKLETIRLILEENKIKLTTDELLDEIVSAELEKTKKFIKK